MATLHTEQDLEKLIEEKLNNCHNNPNVCSLGETEEGKKRLVNKIKQMIFEDGFTNIDACIAQIESEINLNW